MPFRLHQAMTTPDITVHSPLPTLVHLPWVVGSVHSDPHDDNGRDLPLGHFRLRDTFGHTLCMQYRPVPGVYSPPVGIYGVRVRTVAAPPAAEVDMARVVGKGGRHFIAITHACGVLYVFARADAPTIEVWGMDPARIDQAVNQINARLERHRRQ